jgi:deoxyadenosine/deoxycytidine kinase
MTSSRPILVKVAQTHSTPIFSNIILLFISVPHIRLCKVVLEHRHDTIRSRISFRGRSSEPSDNEGGIRLWKKREKTGRTFASSIAALMDGRKRYVVEKRRVMWEVDIYRVST